MSREVDISSGPLSQEDYKYLVERSRGDLIERAHAMHGTSDADYSAQLVGDDSGPRVQPLLQGESRAERRERLLRELEELDAAEAPDESTDEEVADRPYSEWTVQELDEELGNRSLPKTGKQADKVRRLEEDDAAA
jgi:hypothetical protein